MPINLLPKTEFEISFWGRFLKWSLTAGRYIIILTELLVIMAFMSRFKLDHDLSDLNDTILGKQALLEASSNTEKVLRLTQARLNFADQKIKSGQNSSETISKITSLIPLGIEFDSLTLVEKNLTLNMTSSSELPLGTFIQALSSDKMFKSVDLTSVSSESEAGLKFVIKVGL